METASFVYKGNMDRFMKMIDNMPECYHCDCKISNKSAHINVSRKDGGNIEEDDIKTIKRITGFKINNP